MTDILWTLQSSGAVYVRVVDRAGNTSPVSSGSGPAHNRIYLPLVVKPVPQQWCSEATGRNRRGLVPFRVAFHHCCSSCRRRLRRLSKGGTGHFGGFGDVGAGAGE